MDIRLYDSNPTIPYALYRRGQFGGRYGIGLFKGADGLAVLAKVSGSDRVYIDPPGPQKEAPETTEAFIQEFLNECRQLGLLADGEKVLKLWEAEKKFALMSRLQQPRCR